MKYEKKLINDILNILKENEYTLSASVVGSIENKSFDQISDIDIVIILDYLSFEKIDLIKNVLLKIDLSEYKLNKKIRINDTFGPLKFDNKDELVFHLMIYDVDSHFEHVINSPFTCFDWERTNLFTNKPMQDIFSVRRLMINDFLSSRRGIYDYINDIKNKQISYRKYVKDTSGDIKESKESFNLDERHKTEYGFHIVKNTITNHIKVLEGLNKRYDGEEFLNKWKKLEPDLFLKYSDFFNDLYRNKLEKEYKTDLDENTLIDFLDDFYKIIEEKYKNSTKILLVRHLRTELNDGRLFGQYFDPDINENEIINLENFMRFDLNKMKIYSSPMKRALQTVEKFKFKQNVLTDDRLLELNYGDSDGLMFEDFLNRFPDYKEKVDSEYDFTFPNGESYSDLEKRMYKLLGEATENMILFTHQGPIRTILGSLFGIPPGLYFKIQIPHAIPLEVIKIGENFIPNINREIFGSIFKDFKYVQQ